MRKTMTFVPTEGRDAKNGYHFVITEMPAMQAEKWAYRALLALAHSGVDIPEGAQKSGMAGLAAAGMKALHSIQFAEAEPLLDEMWTCVQVMPDPKNPKFTRPLQMGGREGDDIEEVTTLWQLREQIFNLHIGFFFKEKR